MIILALLILLAIVYGYSWLTYRIKTTQPEIVVTVPKPNASGGYQPIGDGDGPISPPPYNP